MNRRHCLVSWCEQNGVELDDRLDIRDDRILSNDYILKDSVGEDDIVLCSLADAQ